MNFAKWLEKKIEERGLKPSQISHYADISHAEISRLLHGKRKPSLKTLKILSNFLRVSEKEILQSAGYLPPEKEPLKTIDIPVLGLVSANSFNLAFQDAVPSDYLTMNYAMIKKDNSYALKIDGECLIEAGIFNGDYIIVYPTTDVTNGDLIVARIRDEATVKKFFRKDDQIILQPCNNKIDPIVISSKEKDFEILGKVISSVRIF